MMVKRRATAAMAGAGAVGVHGARGQASPSGAAAPHLSGGSAGSITGRFRSHSSMQRAARHSHALRTTTVSGAQRHSAARLR